MPSRRSLLPLLLVLCLCGAGRSAAQETSSDAATLARVRRDLREKRLTLQTAELPADFRLAIFEQWLVDDMLSKMDFGTPGPVPAGGIYAYEQQRLLFNPINYPLMQPYAAYSGGEFTTIAIENLVGHYLGRSLVAGVAEKRRLQQERAAKEDVAETIADYCAQRPDRDTIAICTR
ncbi:MAG: hypothetical protein LBQ09_11230 [Acidobacteriaceae bacterium]|jgi:hypothetical protein|nr:hypothetical protein [Acidobacteriaceae bacterium]